MSLGEVPDIVTVHSICVFVYQNITTDTYVTNACTVVKISVVKMLVVMYNAFTRVIVYCV